MKHLFSRGLLFLSLLLTHPLTGLDLSPEGEWSDYGVSGSWRIAMPGWTRFLSSKTAEFTSPAPNTGVLTEKGKTIHFSSTCVPVDDSLRFRSILSSKDFPDFGQLDYQLRIPFSNFRALFLDGKRVEIPQELEKVSLGYFPKKAHFLELETDSGVLQIRGTFSLQVQDNRKWSDALALLLNSGKRKDAGSYEVDLTLKFLPGESRPLSLKSVVNMGFRDDVAGDGRGGWTDQGPENDLRPLSPGKLLCSGIEFRIPDPSRNNGRGCLVLSRSQKKFSPSATLRIPEGKTLRYLHLLHASAWPPPAGETIGTIQVRYSDGRRETIPVRSGIDGGNWWISEPFRNAAIAWEGNNFKARIGLYASAFRLSGEPVAELVFEPEGNAVWMICGATFADRGLKWGTKEGKEIIRSGKEWLPVSFSRHTEKGSPLDFSGSLDAPAGKYGRIITNEKGHFVFRANPGKRIRFLGVNLCQTANYLSKQEAEEFTEQIARAGCNSVRFHHFENLLMAKRGGSPAAFDPQKLDALHYLMACLKKRGIYYTLDLYASRELSPGRSSASAKLLFGIDAGAQKNWEQFAKALLTTRNPYTNLTPAEDPALYLVNLVNESNLSFQLPKSGDPDIRREFQKRWKSWRARLGNRPPGEEGSGLWHAFLNTLERQRIRKQSEFLRREIGSDVLITDLNFISEYALNGIRSELPVVDMHAYWDHMRLLVPGRWAPPQQYSQLSALGQGAAHVRIPMRSRIFGRPYVLTEVNYCYPNRYRAEYAPMFGGYAALQDWDGIYRFAWSHVREALNNGMIGGFDIAKDPSAQLADRLIHALFLRGDAAPAENGIAVRFQEKELAAFSAGAYSAVQAAAGEFSFLGLFTRIGILPEGVETPDGMQSIHLLSDWKKSLGPKEREFLAAAQERKTLTSSTGELILDPQKKTLRVVTPRTEALAGSGMLKGEILQIRGAAVPQTVALISLDNRPLSESRKVLLLHLVEMANTDQTFRSARRNVLESYGKGPLLLRRCRTEVSLHLPEKRRVETLDFSGRRTGEVSVRRSDGALHFTADTALRPHGVMAYLISAE